MAALPLPVATSRTIHPAWRSAVSHRCSAWKTIRAATTEKSPLAQVGCWRDLTAVKLGVGIAVTAVAVDIVRGLLVEKSQPINSTTGRSVDNTPSRATMSI